MILLFVVEFIHIDVDVYREQKKKFKIHWENRINGH